MTTAAADAKLNNWTYTVNTSSKLCKYTKKMKHVEDVIAEVVTAIGLDLEFPATNWFYYSSRMLGSYLPHIEQQTYASTREGYPNGVLIVVSFSILCIYSIYTIQNNKYKLLYKSIIISLFYFILFPCLIN